MITREIVKKAMLLIKAEGGVTFNNEVLNPTAGYIVSILGHEEVLNTHELDEEALWEYVEAKRSIIDAISNLFIGVWFNSDSNQYVLDLSEQILDKETAILRGISRKQLAIYDANNQVVINLPEPQKSGTMTQQQTYLTLKVRELLEVVPTRVELKGKFVNDGTHYEFEDFVFMPYNF